MSNIKSGNKRYGQSERSAIPYKSSLLSFAVMAPALLVSSPGAIAADERALPMLEEILVTARRRSESLQDVPIAVTALSADYIEKNNIVNLEDIRTNVPSMGISAAGSTANTPIISLRGQRPSETILTLDAAVSLYFADIVMLPTHGTNLAMYDLASIQVLRGPQGTLFGRNSTGGALLLQPREAGDELGGYVRVKAGDYGLISGEFGVDLPVNDRLRFRIAGKKTERDGYQDNVATGDKEEFWDEDSSALRLTMDWDLTDNLNNELIVDWSENKTTGRVPIPVAFNSAAFSPRLPPELVAGFEAAVDAQIARDDWTKASTDILDAFEDVENLIIANTTTWDINDNLTVKNIFGYRDVDWSARSDIDGTTLPAYGARPGVTDFSTVESEQFSNEIQLLGTNGMGGKLDWIIGAYFYQMDGSQTQPVQATFGVWIDSPRGDVKNEAAAIFGEANYRFTDQLTMTLGLRQSWDNREVTVNNKFNILSIPVPFECNVFPEGVQGGIPPFINGALPEDACFRTEDESFSAPTWRLGLSYDVGDDAMLYGSISTGYRTGGINLRGTNDASLLPYDEETVLNYEIGYKGDWQLGSTATMRTNVALFLQDYEDIQKTDAVVQGGVIGTTTTNAGEATIQGAELELWILPTANLELGFSWAYVDADYDKWIEDGVDVSHRPFIYVPENTLNASIRYTLPLDPALGDIGLQVSYYYSSKQQLTDKTLSRADFPDVPADQFKDATVQDSYGVIDFRVDWTSFLGSDVDLAAWVKNADDEQYTVGGLEVLESLGLAAHVYGLPRTWGLSVAYNF